MIWILALFAMLYPFPVLAEEAQIRDFCQKLPAHIPDDDVNFRPGRDNVVPADLNPLNTGTFEKVDIPITVQLAERFPTLNIPADLELEPNVGMISIYMDGRVEYNGRDISSQAYSLCEKSASVSVDTGNGQPEKDGLSSDPEKDTNTVKSDE